MSDPIQTKLKELADSFARAHEAINANKGDAPCPESAKRPNDAEEEQGCA